MSIFIFSHGGSVVIPKSDEETTDILDIVSKHKKECIEVTESTYKKTVWLGARKINDKWYSENGTLEQRKPLNYTKIEHSRALSYSNCSYLRSDGVWMEGVKTCTKFSLCTICEIEESPVFTMKGICIKSDYDWNYYLSVDDTNQIKVYEGYKKSSIIFNSTDQKWKMIDPAGYSGNSFAQLVPQKFSQKHPIGRRAWFIEEQYCNIDDPQYILTISKCDIRTQFTCNSGNCIDIENRCDEAKDCRDGSDEDKCELIHIPSSYNPANPPESSANHPLEIITNIHIVNIGKIDTVNMAVTLTMKISVQWNDTRLKYSNLISNARNPIPKQKQSLLWSPLPAIIQENSIIGETKYDSNDDMCIIAKFREKSDRDNPIENRLFNGSFNSLCQARRMKIKYDCPSFNVWRFPFDQQKCPLIIKLTRRNCKFCNLVKWEGVTFLGNRSLVYDGESIVDQFSIGTIYSTVTNDQHFSKMIINIPMTRVSTNQFINTFFPTIILWMFGYSTLFIDPTENGFNHRFTGSGTALLVMATLINVVKSDLPKTAHIKLIDIWFLWHVVLVFVIIVYHITLDRIRNHLESGSRDENAVLDMTEDDIHSSEKHHIKIIRNINKACVILFLTINVAFYIIYFYIKLS